MTDCRPKGLRRVGAVLATVLLAACADTAPLPVEAAAAGEAGGPVRPAKLGLCASCHTESGWSRTPGTPHLAGQDERYLRESLQAYRDGRRQAGTMTAVAGTLTADDIAALAAWYAAQPPRSAAP